MTTETEPETLTLLRRWKDGPVIALFPLVPEYHLGTCSSYAQVGQHSAADFAHVIRSTRPVDPAEPEAVELLSELRAIGYRVRLGRRLPAYRAIDASREALRASRLVR